MLGKLSAIRLMVREEVTKVCIFRGTPGHEHTRH